MKVNVRRRAQSYGEGRNQRVRAVTPPPEEQYVRQRQQQAA